MVLGVAMMAAMVPTVYGLSEASNKSQDAENRRQQDIRKTRSHIICECHPADSTAEKRAQIDKARIFLGPDKRIYITKNPDSTVSPFNGHFFSHPDFEEGNLAGLVSASCEKPPQMRWVFVDAATREMKWGGKTDYEGHDPGPFDLTDEGYITLDENGKWWAVQVEEELWKVYQAGEDGESPSSVPAETEKIRIALRRNPAESG